MRYPKFCRQHPFVGSGVNEGGVKTVIGSLLKQSSMFWTVRSANSIIALRCCHLNGRFENYWERSSGRLTSTSTSRTQRDAGDFIFCAEYPRR
jgi:hypothetical protein